MVTPPSASSPANLATPYTSDILPSNQGHSQPAADVTEATLAQEEVERVLSNIQPDIEAAKRCGQCDEFTRLLGHEPFSLCCASAGVQSQQKLDDPTNNPHTLSRFHTTHRQQEIRQKRQAEQQRQERQDRMRDALLEATDWTSSLPGILPQVSHLISFWPWTLCRILYNALHGRTLIDHMN